VRKGRREKRGKKKVRRGGKTGKRWLKEKGKMREGGW